MEYKGYTIDKMTRPRRGFRWMYWKPGMGSPLYARSLKEAKELIDKREAEASKGEG